jgi:cytidine deaminase
MNNQDIEELIKRSIVVRQNSYSPYSQYKVGAAVLTKKGNIYTGCNFENVSFGAGVCAERVAIGNAISNGEKEFSAICVCGNHVGITPCGICRQAIAEFGNIPIICCDETGENYSVYELDNLLPSAFKELK